MLKKYERVFCHHFGGWWSFTFEEWNLFIDEIVKSGVYVGFSAWPYHKKLDTKPWGNYHESSTGKVFFSDIKKKSLCINIKDWKFDNFVEMLSILKGEKSEQAIHKYEWSNK